MLLLFRSTESSGWRLAANVAAVVSILLGVIVFAWRGTSAWRASETAPGTAVTSGCEEESFFAVWRVAHGEPTYLDRTRPPFAAAYFNWAFYRGYAASLRPFVSTYGGKAVVAGSRWLTAAGAVAGVFVLAGLFHGIDSRRRAFGFAVASWVFFGPLVGWWAHTCRPDVWAMTFEAAGLAVLLRYRCAAPWRGVVGAALLFAAAWSFKQTYVTGFVAAAAFLVVRRQYAQGALLIAIVASVAVATLIALGPNYRAAQAATAATSTFYASLGLANTTAAAAKSLPLCILAFAAVLAVFRRRPREADGIADDALLLGVLATAIGGAVNVVASAKLGASANYLFAPSLGLAIAGVAGLRLWPNVRFAFAASMAAVALHVAVLTGTAGAIRLDDEVEALSERWRAVERLPEPRFSEDTRLELPWLNPHSPPFVLAYLYEDDRRRGITFAEGGIGGLIESGFFQSLFLLDTPRADCFGGSLARYQAGPAVAGMRTFERHPTGEARGTRIQPASP